ncbi:unnamed protein product, partial [Mesorhabditis spiculigera]
MSMSLIGGGILALLLAGYLGQKYGLPPPAPKVAGVDLGTTYSSIGICHAVTGETTILADDLGKRSVPSVVAWLPNGTVLVGTRAVAQQEHNPSRTIYDAKRFIGRTFDENNPLFKRDQKRYPFAIKLDETRHAYFEIPLDSGIKIVYPHDVGAIIIRYLRDAAEKQLGSNLAQVVISVPAEFEEKQREYTSKAAELAGMEVLEETFGKHITDQEDIQQIRLEVEAAKLRLTSDLKTTISLDLKTTGAFKYEITRDEFEELNHALLESIKEPIRAALEDARKEPSDIDEIVLVGGSTRIPRVRKLVGQYFGKAPNFGIDPELAVATGAAAQAGVIGGAWGLKVGAVELPIRIRKRHFYSDEQKVDEKEF